MADIKFSYLLVGLNCDLYNKWNVIVILELVWRLILNIDQQVM